MSKSQPKKKLLLLGGASLPADALGAFVGEEYEFVTVPPERLGEEMEGAETIAVLTSPADLITLGVGFGDPRMASLLRAIGEGVCLVSAEGELLWSDERFNGFPEPTRRAIVARCSEAAHQFTTSGARRLSLQVDVEESGEQRHLEITIAPAASAPVEAPAAASNEQRIPPGAVVAVVWDITESHRARQTIEAVDRAGRELIRLDPESVRGLNAAERLTLLEEKIVKVVRRLLRFDHFSVRVRDEKTGKLEVVMSVGLPREASEIRLEAAADGQGIMGHVASTGQSYLCRDVAKDSLYVSGLEGARSSLTTPLLLDNQVIGVINFESEAPDAFSEQDRICAEILARYVAIALHILDLLVLERWSTNEAVSGRVEGEVAEPLEDLASEAEWLRRQAASDPEFARHIDRVLGDVEAIRKRIRDVARGPRTILGADKLLREERREPLFESKRVLVVDDETSIRETIREVLQQRGCRVVLADTGAAALDQLEAARRNGERFDLVISDIMMPDRNGYEVFSAAKRVDADLPVILMTGFGYDPHHSVVRASQEGLSCVLFKPFQAARLVDEARKALKGTCEDVA